MSSDVLVAVLTGLGGMLGWGLADFFAKKTIDEIGDIVSLVVAHIFGTLTVLAVAVFALLRGVHLSIPTQGSTWLLLALFGALQGAVYLLVYRGFGKGQLAVLNPIFASYSGLVALVSVLFLGEILTGNLVLALITIFVGVLFLNLDLSALRNQRLDFVHVPGFKEIAGATVLATVWTLGWNAFVHGQDWLSYALWMYVFMTITLLLYAWISKISLRITKSHVWKYLVLIGLFETGAYIAISWGYGATSHVSIVALLSGAFSLPTIFLARTFLREKVTALQTIGSLVIIAGIALISLV